MKVITHRIAKFTESPSVRTQRRKEKASADTHQAMRVFLTAVTDGFLEQGTIDKHLECIGKAASPLTKSNPSAVRKVYKDCLRMQLAQMPLPELKTLKDQTARNPKVQANPVLRHIGIKVNEALVRKASDNTHEAMREFLTALAQGPQTSGAIDMHMRRLCEVIDPLTESAPQAAPNVLWKCLQMQLEGMSSLQLQMLIEQLAFDPNLLSDRRLSRIAFDARVVLLRQDPDIISVLRMLDHAFQASQAGNASKAADQLWQAKGGASRLVRKLGITLKSGDSEFEAGEALLKEIFALWMWNNPADEKQLARFLEALPPAMQAKWQAAKTGHLAVYCGGLNTALDKAIDQAEHSLTLSLRQACQAAQSPLASADQMLAVAQAMEALRSHCAAFQRQPRDPSISDEFHEFRTRIAYAMASDSLDPQAMSDQELGGLSRALKSLEIPRRDGSFAREIAHRKQVINQKHAQTLSTALAQLSIGELENALASLRQADADFSALVRLHQALGEDLRDVDAHTELTHTLLTQIVNGLPEATCLNAFNALNDTQALLLAEVFAAMGPKAKGNQYMLDIAQIGRGFRFLVDVLGTRLKKQADIQILTAEQGKNPAALLNDDTYAIAQRFTNNLVRR